MKKYSAIPTRSDKTTESSVQRIKRNLHEPGLPLFLNICKKHKDIVGQENFRSELWVVWYKNGLGGDECNMSMKEWRFRLSNDSNEEKRTKTAVGIVEKDLPENIVQL